MLSGTTSLENKKANIKEEVREKTIGYITAAFGLIAGLAWNEAIKSLIDYIFPMSQGGLLVKFVYAALMTLLLVLVTVYLIKLVSHKKDEK